MNTFDLVHSLNCFLVTVESTEQSDQLKQSLKDEKQTRKRLESKVDHIEEELNDLRHEKESLERVRVLLAIIVMVAFVSTLVEQVSLNCLKVSGFKLPRSTIVIKNRATFSSNQK